MSTTGSTSATGGISFSGLISGLNTTSIISALLQVDQQPIAQLQSQEATIKTTQAAMLQLQSLVSALGTDLSNLSKLSTFNTLAGSSSDSTVATLTTSSGSAAGTYQLAVSQLAAANKIASAGQSGVSTALNLAGTIVVGGHAVDIANSDSLTTIAQKINSTNSGITASLISGSGATGSYLTLTNGVSGAANTIQVVDLSGTVAQSLGLIGGTSSVRSPIPNGAQSTAFSSQNVSLGSLLQASAPPAGSFTINGVSVSADFNTDSLSSIASAINAASAGVIASVVPTTANGTTTYQLQIVGQSGTPTFTDPNGLLADMGVLQNNYGDQLVAAQDANFSLDGINLTSPTNTVASAIPGTTLTLLKAGTPTNPTTSTLTISTDTSGIDSQVSQFVSDYNAITSYISQEASFDPKTNTSGPLFGDFTTEQVQAQISNMLFNNVPGLSSSLNNLSLAGFSLDQTGTLQFNQTTFNNALASNPHGLAQLFSASGSTSNPSLAFISNTSKTVSTGQPYEVNVSQAATQSSVTAGTGQTLPEANAEQLTFNGNLFGNSPYVLTLAIGNSLQDTVDQVNSDATLKNVLTASIVNGALAFTSKTYGTPSNFTVTSNTAAGPDNSGIGTSGGTVASGLDVAGTINGEAATGSGQLLTGNSGNSTSDGLQVKYTGSASGDIGTVTYLSGIANQMNNLVTRINDSSNGLFAAANTSYNNQVSAMDQQITELQQQVAAQQTLLQNEFSQMENAIAALQQQSARLSSMFGTNGLNSSQTGSTTGVVG